MSEKTLAHLGYVVRNMESALKRFVREGAQELIAPMDDPLQGVRVCLLNLEGGVEVELVSPLNVEDHPVQARLARGGGLDHICYFLDDLDAELEREKERGGLVVCEPIYAVAFLRDVAFVHRRSGLVVELMTRHQTEPPP